MTFLSLIISYNNYLQKLKKQYPMGETIVKALDGINLSVKKGEFLAIVGTSGSDIFCFCFLEK